MSKTGLLGQSKPAANTNTLLYSAPIDKSASAVLTVANDGTGSAYSVGIKNWDQVLTVGASNYLLHPGDLFSSYQLTMGTSMSSTSGFTEGATYTTEDGEKSFRFESFVIPAVTTVFVKDILVRAITLESGTGTFTVGDTVQTGDQAGGNHTTAVVFGVGGTGTDPIIYVGPSTINGSGAEFAAGDNIANSGATASGTVAAGGVATAAQRFAFSTTTAGGTYNLHINGLATLTDRTYRFDVSDSSMSGRDFKLSTTVNGEWGPDGVFGSGTPIDDGVEYTTNKTTNGTAGSSGAYVQYAFKGTNISGFLYYYDGGTGTAGNNIYGGNDRSLQMSTAYTYEAMYVYDVVGTIAAGSDTFLFNNVTYTISTVTAGAYGYVRDYTGSTLKICLGAGSPAATTSTTFFDNPKDDDAGRTEVTVSAVVSGQTDLDAENYIVVGGANAANNVARTTSIVIGPSEKIVVNSVTQNNTFSLLGFEDNSTSFPIRGNVTDYSGMGGGGGGAAP